MRRVAVVLCDKLFVHKVMLKRRRRGEERREYNKFSLDGLTRYSYQVICCQHDGS